MMSNLLDFQDQLLKNGKAIYCIETAKLNPRNIEIQENEESTQLFEKQDFSLRNIRIYLIENKGLLARNGNFIQGEVKNNMVALNTPRVKYL